VSCRQVLELQSRLDDKEIQLAAMTQQLRTAGLRPVDALQQPPGIRASLADISNVGIGVLQPASPGKDSMQVMLVMLVLTCTCPDTTKHQLGVPVVCSLRLAYATSAEVYP
jgi:hypothetical protein